MRRSLFVVWLVLAASTAMAQSTQQKLSTTQSSLKKQQEQEARLKKELAATNDALDEMRARATALASSLQKTERRASSAEENLDTLNRELAAKEKEFDARKDAYARTVASMLRMRRIPPSAMFADPEHLNELMLTGNVMQRTNEALAERAGQLRTDVKRLQGLRRDVASSKTVVSREKATLAEQQKQLAADLATRQRLQRQLQKDYGAAQAQVSKLSREASNLQDLINKLEKNRSSGQFATATRSTPAAAMPGMRSPVAGTVIHRFGERKNKNEAYRGMVLAARPGATVVAPNGGEVVFTGPFRDYGQMVLIKHGGGYITLLAGVGSISVGLNQQVAKGEPVGSMGSGSPQLYVELRERSKPIDPARWFAKLG